MKIILYTINFYCRLLDSERVVRVTSVQPVVRVRHFLDHQSDVHFVRLIPAEHAKLLVRLKWQVLLVAPLNVRQRVPVHVAIQHHLLAQLDGDRLVGQPENRSNCLSKRDFCY